MADIVTTIGALVNAEPALQKLIALKLDAKTRYHAVKLSQLVSNETKWHFFLPRQEAFKEFGTERQPSKAELSKHGPDPIYEVPPEKLAAFLERLRELTSVEATIAWGPITSTMLEKYEDFTGADMLALGPLCVLDDERKTDAST